MAHANPFSKYPIVELISRKIDELSETKNLNDLAAEVGYTDAQIISMFGSGAAKIPLDRVPRLAQALGCDAHNLFEMALEQHFKGASLLAIKQMLGRATTKNETEWLDLIRETSGGSDPNVTATRAKIVRAMLGKLA